VQKRKKKKHPEILVGRVVKWSEPHDPDRMLIGKVINQKTILEVELHGGTVLGVDASKVTIL
jgi:hypothetical protein